MFYVFIIEKYKIMKQTNENQENNIIHNYQLSNHQFDIETLEKNIDNLSLRRLLLTQYLTLEFCLKYILNPEEHGMCNEDYYISKEDILTYQSHISKEELYSNK